MPDTDIAIAALRPRGGGHQFVIYGDACSGVPEAPHARAFARVNAVLARLDPAPQFIIFVGDEIIGLAADAETLRAQWRHWRESEMAWLDARIPIYHATGNHTAYDATSEAVFREMLPHLPRNGPRGQEGLSYLVRRDDLLMVFVHTLWSGLGGEGHVETAWLAETLHQHADARHKLVIGHHPVHPVNGFSGAYQRDIGPEHAATFWDLLVAHGVLAYVCSHILAFDVQVHRGVLQITTAGAGTLHRMPEELEYLHAVQGALDAEGFRYQVLDADGVQREHLSWPLRLPPADQWMKLPAGRSAAPVRGAGCADRIVAFRFAGRAAPPGTSAAQTLLAASDPGLLPALWIGMRGPQQKLTVLLGAQAGRSPHLWHGPAVRPGIPFDLEVLIHCGMGPGGLLWRAGGSWSSLTGASAWGAERLAWPAAWSVGHGARGAADEPFAGGDLAVATATLDQPSPW
jgi:hypothetical protein